MPIAGTTLTSLRPLIQGTSGVVVSSHPCAVVYLQRTDNCPSASSGGISPFHHHRRETIWGTIRFSMCC
jgi:hypothetical protein